MNKIKTNIENELLCPNCNDNYLHQVKVETVFRPEDQDGIRIVSGHAGTKTDIADASEITGRRDVVKIGFVCECCSAEPELVIIQHKGSTKLHWSDI